MGLRLIRKMPDPPTSSTEQRSRLLKVWDAVSTAGTTSLWGTIYLMQFAQWWYQREHLLQPYQPRKVPPPPPARPPYEDVSLPPMPKGSTPQAGDSRLVWLPQDRTI